MAYIPTSEIVAIILNISVDHVSIKKPETPFST